MRDSLTFSKHWEQFRWQSESAKPVSAVVRILNVCVNEMLSAAVTDTESYLLEIFLQKTLLVVIESRSVDVAWRYIVLYRL